MRYLEMFISFIYFPTLEQLYYLPSEDERPQFLFAIYIRQQCLHSPHHHPRIDHDLGVCAG